MRPRILEVRAHLLKKNDELARDLRREFAAAGVAVVNVVSSPGAGKTELLAHTLRELRPKLRVAAIVGDLATENDAERLRLSGAPARQIITGAVCHLEAQMVREALAGWRLDELDLLLIENVGNLVCPASFDLGEDLRVLLLSVTEGEDKPLKYPTLIHTADLVLLSKVDLAAAVGFNRAIALGHIQRVRPGVPVLEVSTRSGAGLADWLARLQGLVADKRSAALPGSVPGSVLGGAGNLPA